jgi:hypothetical protein
MWRTPAASDPEGGPLDLGLAERMGYNPKIKFRDQSVNWPTPRAEEREQHNSEDRGEALSRTAARWPTPHAALMNDGADPGVFRRRQAALRERGINGDGAGVPLTIAAQEFTNAGSARWPSPRVGQGKTFKPKSDGRQGLTLEGFAERWHTPIGRDYKDGAMDPGAKTPTNAILGRQVLRTGLGGTESLPGGPTSGQPHLRPRLNSRFVSWMMNLPVGWVDVNHQLGTTNYVRWETQSSRLARQSLSRYCMED